MEQKNLIIICITVVAIVAIICGAIYLTSVKDTSLSISDSKVTKGDTIHITLVDEKGNPLINKNITINVTDSKNKTKSYNVATDDKGKYDFKVKLSKGEYIFNVEYKGELLLKSSIITKKVTVKEKEESKQNSASSHEGYPYYEQGLGYYKLIGVNLAETQDGRIVQLTGAGGYSRQKGSSFYESHSYMDIDGDGYISGAEMNQFE